MQYCQSLKLLIVTAMCCRICIALYKLASCAEYRVVAPIFSVSKTSVYRYLHRFASGLCTVRGQYIRWYTTEEAIQMPDYIGTHYKYPQAIGAIDGSHIPVNPPADEKADYICCKECPSIVLQGFVYGMYRFRDAYANASGAAHDPSVFNRKL